MKVNNISNENNTKKGIITILIAIVIGIFLFLLFGIVASIIPNKFFTRMTPVGWLEYASFLTTSLLLGAYIGLTYYQRKTKSVTCDASATTGGIFGFLTFGCSICNKILVFFLGVAGVFLSYIGFKWRDAIGAFIVGIYIISVAITALKSSSLILIDAFNNPELVKDISRVIRKHPTVRLKDLKLRTSGPYIIGEITVMVDSNMSVGRVYLIKNKTKDDIMKRINGVKELTILADPEGV